MGALAALSWDDRAEGLSQLWHASLLMRVRATLVRRSPLCMLARCRRPAP